MAQGVVTAKPANEAVEETVAVKAVPGHMFQYSDFVHVGPGAEGCPERDSGDCADPLHFHAWVRLPNQFQFMEIRRKALAAKARRARQFQDKDEDAYITLFSEIKGLAGDRERIIQELLGKYAPRDMLEAMRDVEDQEEFATIREDRERLRVLFDTPEDVRDRQEFDELEKHVNEFHTQVEKAFDDRQAPFRGSLEGKPVEELEHLLINDRIDRDTTQEFTNAYMLWQIHICTFKPNGEGRGFPNSRIFGSTREVRDETSPEVIDALQETFNELETSITQGAAEGN